MKKAYQMEDIDCAHCAAKMETAIRAIDGVVNASINFLAQKLTIEFADDATEKQQKQILKEAQKAVKKVDSEATILF
ncbi:MAG: cation transporter [Clostridia bacterium]|nr:cation transporter [Clostridia bacterium]